MRLWTPRAVTTIAASMAAPVTNRVTRASLSYWSTGMLPTANSSANRPAACVKWARCLKKRTTCPTMRIQTWSESTVNIKNILRSKPSGPQKRRKIICWTPPNMRSLLCRVLVVTMSKEWPATTTVPKVFLEIKAIVGGRSHGWCLIKLTPGRVRIATTDCIALADRAPEASIHGTIIIVPTCIRRESSAWMRTISTVPAAINYHLPGPLCIRRTTEVRLAHSPTRSRSDLWRRSAWALLTAGSSRYVEFPLRRRSCLTWYIRHRKWDTLPTIVPRYFRRNDRVNHAPRDSAHACSFGREYAFVQKRIAECVKKKMVRLHSYFIS